MADKIVKTFNTLVTETSFIRNVADDMLLLDENRAVLYQLTNSGKKKTPTYSPRIEWFEDTDLPFITTNTIAGLVGDATLTVADVSLFGINDLVQLTTGEIALVTAVAAGTGVGLITITRGFGGTTAAAVPINSLLRILGTAWTETGAPDTPRQSTLVNKLSGAQIFESPTQISKTGAATKKYMNGGSERARVQEMAMRRQKLEIENAGLFGVYSETLAGANSRYTSMGVRTLISTNVTDAGGALALQPFLTFCLSAFRYGKSQKLFLASSTIKH